MSNVLARFRGISDMEFYANAETLYKELSRFLMNDNYIPKKWRTTHAYPIIALMDTLFDTMEDANAIYPTSEDEVKVRKELQRECVLCCEKIYGRLQRAILVIWWDTLHRDEDDPGRQKLETHLTEIGNILDQEIKLLKGWRKSTHLLTKN